jgi:hypothetical protein
MLKKFSKLFTKNEPEEANEKIKESIGKLNAKQRKRLAEEGIEFHLPGHKFVGPGTNLKSRLTAGDVPVSKLDLGALKHDLYYSAGSQELRAESDKVLLNEAYQILKNNPFDPNAIAVATAMSAKIALNSLGIPTPLEGERKPANVKQEVWDRTIFENRKIADEIFDTYMNYLENKGVSYLPDGSLKQDKSIIRSDVSLQMKRQPAISKLSELEQRVKNIGRTQFEQLFGTTDIQKMSTPSKAKLRAQHRKIWKRKVLNNLNVLVDTDKTKPSAEKYQSNVINFVASVREMFKHGISTNHRSRKDLINALKEFESLPNKQNLTELIANIGNTRVFRSGKFKLLPENLNTKIDTINQSIGKYLDDAGIIPNVNPRNIELKVREFDPSDVESELASPGESSELSSERSESSERSSDPEEKRPQANLNEQIKLVNEGLTSPTLNPTALDNLAIQIAEDGSIPENIRDLAKSYIDDEQADHVNVMALRAEDLVRAILESPEMKERLTEESLNLLRGPIVGNLNDLHSKIIQPYEGEGPDINKLFENLRASLGEVPPKLDGLADLAKKVLTITQGDDSDLEKFTKALLGDRVFDRPKVNAFLNSLSSNKIINRDLSTTNKNALGSMFQKVAQHYEDLGLEEKKEFPEGKPVPVAGVEAKKEVAKPVQVEAEAEAEPRKISAFRSRKPIFEVKEVRPPSLPPTAKGFEEAKREREVEIRKGLIEPEAPDVELVKRRAKQFDVIGEDQLDSQDFQKTWPTMRMIQDKELKKEIDNLDADYIKKDTANFSYEPVSMEKDHKDSSLYKDGLMIDKLRDENKYLIEGDVGLIRRVGLPTIHQMDTPMPAPPGQRGLFLQASAGHSQSRLTAPTKYSGIVNVPLGSKRQLENAWRELPYAEELDVPMSSIARTGAPPISMDPTWHSYLVPLESGSDLTREGFVNNPNIAPTVPEDNAYTSLEVGKMKITNSSLNYV